MKIDLRQLFDIVGERQTLERTLDFSKEEWYGGYPFQTPIQVSGQIENKAGVVRFIFGVKFALQLTCDRCLKVFERTFAYSFEHILVKSLNTDNDEFVVCEDSTLDLMDLIRADLFLELPVKVLCQEDCKGLCGQCGKNLNFDSCECEKQSIDPRLEVLSQLLK
ncbi:MAG: DUF177 domain-containing protein [Oscillospiraceae bacterium]